MLKNHIKGGLKVLSDYGAALLIYVILLYTFIAITGDKFTVWLPLYSFVMFLFMYAILYADMWSQAAKEKKPQYELNPYPLKGLVFGLIGFSPFIIIAIVSNFLKFEEPVYNSLKDAIIQNILFGPLYFSINLLGKTFIAYLISCLIVPILSMAAYLMGYYGIELRKVVKIKKEVPVVMKQELSPWNPTRQVTSNKKKKKKVKKNI